MVNAPCATQSFKKPYLERGFYFFCYMDDIFWVYDPVMNILQTKTTTPKVGGVRNKQFAH